MVILSYAVLDMIIGLLVLRIVRQAFGIIAVIDLLPIKTFKFEL